MPLRRAALAFGLALLAVTTRAADDTERVALGRQLFEENWLRPAADDSPLTPTRNGDGLGPLFNAGSCVACHKLGGIGGAGGNEHNVELMSLILPIGTPNRTIRQVARRAKDTHPGFFDSTDVTLHRFGRDGEGSLKTYDDFRRRLRSAFAEPVLPAHETQEVLTDGLVYQLAQRNTPAVFGAGLIDQVPASFVQRVAERQKELFPQLAGRPSDGGAGRFGWRGHVSSLDDFVRTACAAELGLRVRARNGRTIHDQPDWPIDGSSAPEQPKLRADMTETQVEALVAFVRSLPAPRQVIPFDAGDATDVQMGQNLFAAIGCAVCHVENMGAAKGIYSDLLLHNMGSVLADRVAAPLPPTRVIRTAGRIVRQSGGGGYSGGSGTIRSPGQLVVIPPSLGDLTAATQEFRTPPLWGVADSAPYLHDGRAETLDEAIGQHGGQAEATAAQYASLSEDERGQLLAFLGTLRAPVIESVVASRDD